MTDLGTALEVREAHSVEEVLAVKLIYIITADCDPMPDDLYLEREDDLLGELEDAVAGALIDHGASFRIDVRKTIG
jgi:hypothetical protein